MSLKGKTAFITGAGRAGKGIGRSIAVLLAQQGANIAIADFVKEAAEAVAGEARALGVEALALQGSVTSSEDVVRMTSEVQQKFEKIDILVNNAGIVRDQLLVRMSDEDWHAVLETNLTGAFLCTREVAKVMIRQREGRIVNMASVMGVVGNAGQANYSASKGGLIALTKTTAKELGRRGINVNAVAPGFIQTVMTEEMPEDARAKVSGQIPLDRLGTPEDVARVVLFLVGELSSYVTGQVINVDGGLVM
ncbi:MAG: 3-oxoacyl-[acyl-carrier-protein] reductase [Armatimonadetes bacterium]|nr:3-oxoacyl-[acyl-carrier-protein] reductase [Armatimonadota bacterium]